jgi:hypothetical protein
MPATRLGLAEVEERLQAIRRRLNSVAALHAASLGLSGVLCLVTLLIVLGLRGSASAFGFALWTGTVLVLGVVGGCVFFVRRRWLDIAATARLADHRGQLMDRLTTLDDLRQRPRSSRLAPLLLAQTLALGEQWRLQRIVPRRIPRSLFLPLAALVLLASSRWLAPESPKRSEPEHAAADRMDSPNPAVLQQAQLQTQPDATHQQSGAADPGAGGLKAEAAGPQHLSARLKLQVEQSQSSGSAATLPSDDSRQDNAAPGLSDRLQEAIRRRFGAEAVDQPRQLAARTDNGSANSTDRTSADQPRGDSRRRDAAQTNDTPAQHGADGERQEPQAPAQAGQPPHHPDANSPDQNLAGSSGAAGTGSSPSGVMDPNAVASLAEHEASKTFKLTISSFLRSAEQRSQAPRAHGEHMSDSGPVGTAAATQTALSEQQLNDDPLRKAEIPAEYEDIVRRVYPRRAAQ